MLALVEMAELEMNHAARICSVQRVHGMKQSGLERIVVSKDTLGKLSYLEHKHAFKAHWTYVSKKSISFEEFWIFKSILKTYTAPQILEWNHELHWVGRDL